jgi:hypothetical protein
MQNADYLDNASQAAAEMLELAISKQQIKSKKLATGMDSMAGVCLMCGNAAVTPSRFCCMDDRDEYDESVRYLTRTGLPPHNPASGLTMESHLDTVRRRR